MLFAFFTDWGTGQQVSFLWLLPAVWLFYCAWKRYGLAHNGVAIIWVVLAVLWSVCTVATLVGSESNRRETAQLKHELTKLDVKVDQVNTSWADNVVSLDDCVVILNIYREGGVWRAKIRDEAAAYVLIGPKLQDRIVKYCDVQPDPS